MHATLAAFVDELEKIAAAHGLSNIPKHREGRRPISVDKLLLKEKDGTLYKRADSQGNSQPVRGAGADDPGAAQPPRRRGEVLTKTPNISSESEKLGEVLRGEVSPFPTGDTSYSGYIEAKKPRKKGDVPTQDNVNVVDRYDGRGEATTVHGLAQNSNSIGAFNSPAEHS